MVRSREMACGISFEATATSTVFFLLVSNDPPCTVLADACVCVLRASIGSMNRYTRGTWNFHFLRDVLREMARV